MSTDFPCLLGTSLRLSCRKREIIIWAGHVRPLTFALSTIKFMHLESKSTLDPTDAKKAPKISKLPPMTPRSTHAQSKSPHQVRSHLPHKHDSANLDKPSQAEQGLCNDSVHEPANTATVDPRISGPWNELIAESAEVVGVVMMGIAVWLDWL